MAYSDTMGSFDRTIRPAVRESERKDKDRQKKALEQSNARELNELEVYLRQITTLHHALITKIDWAAQTRPEAQDIYQKMRQGDKCALIHVIKGQHTLGNMRNLGRGVGFTVDRGLVHAVLSLHDQSIVPDFQLKTMPSGKLVEVEMPKEKALKIYRAYASSAVLKVASDLFRLVPIGNLVVSAIAPCRAQGEGRDGAILSVNLNRKTILSMDMASVSPVIAVKAFQHSERFHQEHGFDQVVPLLSIPAGMIA